MEQTKLSEKFVGLAQVTSLQGGSRTQFAISCLDAFLQVDPPSPTSAENGYFVFISDEGSLYPPALAQKKIPLFRMLLVKTQDALSTWQASLEAIQTGLFEWIFLRPSKPCSPGYLRKLQLAAEKNHSRVLILSQEKLPHWLLKTSLEIGK
jgi:hypothetical protein